jgi:hypothetical protein
MVLVLAGIMVAVQARSRRRTRAARRGAAIERLAGSLERVSQELEWTPSAPSPTLLWLSAAGADRGATKLGPRDPATGLPQRAALVDALVRDIARVRRDGGRLGLALVDVGASGSELESAMTDVAAAAGDAAQQVLVFRSGERSLALVLRSAGRADTMLAVARLEATLGGRHRVQSAVVELEPGEDAAALLARASSARR